MSPDPLLAGGVWARDYRYSAPSYTYYLLGIRSSHECAWNLPMYRCFLVKCTNSRRRNARCVKIRVQDRNTECPSAQYEALWVHVTCFQSRYGAILSMVLLSYFAKSV